MLSRLIAEQALAAALRTGGDFAEIFYEDTRSSSLTLNAGAIETALTGRTAGAGVRVYKGLSSVYVHTNDASLSGLVRAAQKQPLRNRSSEIHIYEPRRPAVNTKSL